jgi:NADH:ubiquinone oxidoreductase subunit E
MRSIEEVLAEHGALSPDSLIPVLQDVQAENGYLSSEAMEELSFRFDIPVSRVYGVATFYKQFRFAPLGEHVVEICRGTACHVKGSFAIFEHLKRRLQLSPAGHSADGKFSVVTVACLGACSIAPVVRIDGEFHGHLTLQKLDNLLDALSHPVDDTRQHGEAA